MTTTITQDRVEELLRETRGGFFTVTFTKRTTGELRVMRATLNLKSALKGGEAKYDAKSKGLLIVRDMDATREGVAPIRSIPFSNVISIVANGETYQVEG
jgi:hypothetical protein